MPASFAYGRRDGQLVHVQDLDEALDRGLRCECVCPECGRALQAHMGAQKAWHFQHHVEDASCNPQPMTLLHAFVRDQLAQRRRLLVPAVSIYSELSVFNRPVMAHVQVPAADLVFLDGEAEVRGDGVQPDVLFKRDNGISVALEVRYSHAVDDEKLQRMRRNYPMALEFDVSDLPASGISLSQLEAVLKQPRRWTWLVSGNVKLAETRELVRLEWAQTVWRPSMSFSKGPEVRPANQKLKLVKRRMPWAREAVLSLRHQGLSGDDSAEWLGAQDKRDRIAVACEILRIDPERLPPFLQQFLPADKPSFTFGHHPYSWQAPVFMKFCVGQKEFSAHEAAKWCLVALADRCEGEDGTLSRNGFTRTAAALHQYFLQLEAQRLLQGAPHVAREARTFSPRFQSVRELGEHLRGAVAAEA